VPMFVELNQNMNTKVYSEASFDPDKNDQAVNGTAK
jgi:hypothetical protein